MNATTRTILIIYLLLACACSDADEADPVGIDMGDQADTSVQAPDMPVAEGRLIYEFDSAVFGEVTQVRMASTATTAMAIVNNEKLIRLEDEPLLVQLPQPVNSEFAIDETFLFFSSRLGEERWQLTAIDYTEAGTMPFWGQPITIFDQGGGEASLAMRSGVLVAGFASTWPAGGGSQLVVTSAPNFEPGLVSVDPGWAAGEVARGESATVWAESDGSATRLRFRSESTLAQSVPADGVASLVVAGDSIFWVDENGTVKSLEAGCFEDGACPEPRTLGEARANTLTSSSGRALWVDTQGQIQSSSGAEPGVVADSGVQSVFSTTAAGSTFWWAAPDGIRAVDF